jgi:hypothetical protein
MTLYWQATQAVRPSYVTFVHVLDSAGQLRAQSDQIPDDALPTYAWAPGEVIPDHHVIHLDESIPAGEYSLVVGVYDSLTQERLPLLEVSNPSQQNNNAVLIGKVSIK